MAQALHGHGRHEAGWESNGFGWDSSAINPRAGFVGAVVALLVWMYVMVAIALVGCEFNAELEHLRRAFAVPHGER